MGIHNKFRENVQRKRREQNITQEKLANMAGIDRSHISNIETGKSIPTILMVEKISIALNTDIFDLFK